MTHKKFKLPWTYYNGHNSDHDVDYHIDHDDAYFETNKDNDDNDDNDGNSESYYAGSAHFQLHKDDHEGNNALTNHDEREHRAHTHVTTYTRAQ